jgi:MFS family permease
MSGGTASSMVRSSSAGEDTFNFNDDDHQEISFAGDSFSRDPLLLRQQSSEPTKYKLSDPRLKGMLILCLTSFFAINFSVSISGSFFPQVAAGRFHLTPSLIGLVLAIYPASLAVFSPLTILLSTYFGRFAVLFLGLVLQVISLFMFGASSTLWGFFFSKVVQGFAGGCVRNATSSLFVVNVENLNDVLSLQGMVSGLGAIISTFAGGWLYSKFGFTWTFNMTAFVVAIFLLINMIVYFCYFGNWKDLDQTIQSQQKSRAFIEVLKILLDRVTIACIFCVFVLALMFGSLEVILAPHLQMALNIDTGVVGVLMVIPGIGLGLSSAFAALFVRWCGARNTIALTIFMCGVSNMLLGPMPFVLDRIPGTNVAWGFMISGLILLGLSIGIGFIPILPIMRDSSEDRVKEANLSTTMVSDIISALFTFSFAIGLIIGPIMTGALMQILPKREQISCVGTTDYCSTSAQWTSSLFGALCILSGILVCIMVPDIRKTHHKGKQIESVSGSKFV